MCAAGECQPPGPGGMRKAEPFRRPGARSSGACGVSSHGQGGCGARVCAWVRVRAFQAEATGNNIHPPTLSAKRGTRRPSVHRAEVSPTLREGAVGRALRAARSPLRPRTPVCHPEPICKCGTISSLARGEPRTGAKGCNKSRPGGPERGEAWRNQPRRLRGRTEARWQSCDGDRPP